MFAFLTPLWLFAVPIAAGLLLYAYLRHGRNRQSKISSLFFIKQVTPSLARGRQKMALPWRLLFELLVLLALIAALSGAFLKSSSQRLVIVIDNSLSMGALLNPGKNNETLLDEAKRSAKSNLDLFSEINQTSVWITSPEPRQITDGFGTSNQARNQISDIAVSFSSGNISAVLARIKKGSNKTLIFSDQSVLPQTESANPSIRLVPLNVLNPRRENVAIESVSMERSIDRDSSNITVIIQSYLNTEALCRIAVTKFANRKWSPLAVREISLSGVGTREVILNIDHKIAAASSEAFKAQIVSCTPDKANLLNLDDSAWLTSEQGQSQITLVSEFSAKQLGLSEISGIRIEARRPEDWELENSGKEGNLNSSLVIFHRYVPKVFPKTNALFISPPEGSGFFKSTKLAGTTQLVRWEKESPIIRYLTLPDISLKDAMLFSELPVWGIPLMYSSAGPIAIYGSLSQHRYATLGFEILPFEGRSNPFLSILTLNLIKWLSSSGENLESGTLSRISLKEPAKKASVIDGTIPEFSAILNLSGNILTLSSPGLVETFSADNNRLISANFFSAEESNLLEPGLLSMPASGSTESQIKDPGLALEIYLIILALAVLFIDSLSFVYRRRRAI